MSDRLVEKLRQRRRRRIWKIAAAVLVLALVVAAVWAVWFSSVLEVRDVEVTGTEHLTQEQVLSAAQVPEATPVPRVDTDAIAMRVGDLLPIESVVVRRDLPHTVTIAVTERSAVAWIEKSGAPWAVDAHGVVYRALASEPSHIPELDMDVDDTRTVKAAARVVADIEGGDPGLARDIQTVSAESRDSIELDLTEGRTVVWGSAEDSEAKLAVLTPLLQIDARTYDVSAPERPTTLQ